MPDREPNLVISSLSGPFSRDGVTVEVSIVRLEDMPGWSLEVVNHANTSIVWQDEFAADDEAMAEFMRTVDEEGMDAFRETATVVPFRR